MFTQTRSLRLTRITLFQVLHLSNFIQKRLSLYFCRRLSSSSHQLEGPLAARRNYSGNHNMPKKDKTNKTVGLQKPLEKPSPSGPVARNKNGVVTISVHAKPGSKQNAITDVSIEAVGVAIAAPPTDGEANAELVRYLSKVLELKRSEVVLDKGSRSREKIIKVTGSLTPEQVLDRLKQEASG
ncbi:UPF0235 protein C15orf40 homolog [Salvelinus alpinus]|uniref:UPF0235 protein C15orf40 homolog n=1 Tax=Salvelinus sp. IW2-2015 TaxID=2691554 RepID=UPI000CDF9778|nr:UPF0235 protein C15orf40 homolog [Salvelinus alpinus]